MAAFPSITPTSINLSSVNPTRMAMTLNGVTERNSSTGQFFRLSADFSNLSQAQVRQILAHVNGEGGPLNSFTFTLPSYLGDSTGTFSGTISVNASASIGATSATITGTSLTYPALKAGDLIKFSNHSKLYTITSDVVTTTMNFYPPLRTAITSAHTVTHKSVPITVRYASDNQEFSIGTDLFTGFNLEFEEVLQ